MGKLEEERPLTGERGVRLGIGDLRSVEYSIAGLGDHLLFKHSAWERRVGPSPGRLPAPVHPCDN